MTTPTREPARPVTILRVDCRGGAGLLRQMSGIFATHGINILSLQANTTGDFRGECTFGIAERAGERLSRLIKDLQRLKDVTAVSATPVG